MEIYLEFIGLGWLTGEFIGTFLISRRKHDITDLEHTISSVMLGLSLVLIGLFS